MKRKTTKKRQLKEIGLWVSVKGYHRKANNVGHYLRSRPKKKRK